MKRLIIEISGQNEDRVSSLIGNGAANLTRTYGGSMVIREEEIREVPTRVDLSRLQIPRFLSRTAGAGWGC